MSHCILKYTVFQGVIPTTSLFHVWLNIIVASLTCPKSCIRIILLQYLKDNIEGAVPLRSQTPFLSRDRYLKYPGYVPVVIS